MARKGDHERATPTVKHHVSNAFDKLGVSSRLELAMFAINHELVRDIDLSS